MEKWVVDELLTYGKKVIEHGDPEWGLIDISALNFKLGKKIFYALKFDFPENKYYPFIKTNEEYMEIWREGLRGQGIDFRGSFYLDIFGKVKRYFTISPLGGIDYEIKEVLPQIVGDYVIREG